TSAPCWPSPLCTSPGLPVTMSSAFDGSRPDFYRRPAVAGHCKLVRRATDGNSVVGVRAPAIEHYDHRAAIRVVEGDSIAAGRADDLGAGLHVLREVTEHVVRRSLRYHAAITHEQ